MWMRPIVALAGLLVAGCRTGQPEGESNERLRVAAILPASHREPACADALEGLTRLRNELGARVEYGEDVPVDRAPIYLREYAGRSDVVIALGPEYLEPALAVAGEFPATRFVVLGARGGGERNVCAAPDRIDGRVANAVFEAARGAP